MQAEEGVKFRTISESISRRFLQTVVVVDDQASLEQPDAPSDAQNLAVLVTPPRGGATRSDTVEVKSPPSPEVRAHGLNAGELINAFATAGLVCSVLRPKLGDDDTGERTISLARRADLVVLDWDIEKDDGRQTLNIIKRIVLDDDAFQRDRMRLIAIYTGDQGVGNVGDRVKAMLKEAGHLASILEKGFVVDAAAVRVVVLAKDYGMVPDPYKERKVAVSGLPERLVQEFSALTAGLVSNVAVASLAALRSKTHVILGILHRDLDMPYLTHRALLSHPEDAQSFLLALVSDEFDSVLDGDDDITATMDDASIEAWLRSGFEDTHEFDIGGTKLRMEQMVALLTTGAFVGNDGKTIQKIGGKTWKTFTAHITPPTRDAPRADDEFSALSKTKTRYLSRINLPILTLGVIVRKTGSLKEKEREFYLCIQPPCDSVRLEGRTAFPFLPFKTAEGDDRFDLVLRKSQAEYVRLSVEEKAKSLIMVAFAPGANSDDSVRAETSEDNSVFTFTAIDGDSYEWVAELKFAQAQKMVNQFAAQISRVGLDDYEWLRRSTHK